MFRKVLSLIMVGMLIYASMSSSSAQASDDQDKSATLAEEMKATVSDLGVGTKVVLKLKGGENLQGKIDSISNEDFVLAVKDSLPRHIKYDAVTQLQLTKLSYKAAGQPNPAAVRRVATMLGTGQNARAKLTLAGGKKLQGYIQKIEQDNFTIVDSKNGPTTVAYGDVTRIEQKGFTTWPYIVIGAGTAVLVLILVGLAYGD